jgi:hypothetical protein
MIAPGAICLTAMRRAAWIFFASIFLPSLGLAWLAIHSVRDQQEYHGRPGEKYPGADGSGAR